MLALYRVSDTRREAMVQIAREVRQPGWQKFVDVPDGVPAYVGLEAAAFGFPAAAERDAVALDSAADALYLEPRGPGALRRVFQRLLPAALTPEASAELIAGR
jgi:hypothetical protein